MSDTHDLTGMDFAAIQTYAADNDIPLSDLEPFMDDGQLAEYQAFLALDTGNQNGDQDDNQNGDQDDNQNGDQDDNQNGDQDDHPDHTDMQEPDFKDLVREPPFVRMGVDLDGDGEPDKTMVDEGSKINNYWTLPFRERHPVFRN